MISRLQDFLIIIVLQADIFYILVMVVNRFWWNKLPFDILLYSSKLGTKIEEIVFLDKINK